MDNFDVDLDLLGDDGNIDSDEKNTVNTGDEDTGYDILEEDDAKYVKIPVEDFEALKQGNMRQQDYTAKTQDVSALTSELEEILQRLDSKTQVRNDESIPDDETNTVNQLDPEQLEEIVNSKLAPIYEAEAKRAIEEETKEFKEKYNFIFTGEKERDEKILSNIYLTAAKYSHDDGSPLALEEAFAIAYKDNLIEYTTQAAQKEQQRRQMWGSEDDSNMGSEKPVIASEQDADKVFQERLVALRGY